jgi:signal peptide peptidase SppA
MIDRQYPFVLQRLTNRPLAIQHDKAIVIASALRSRLNISAIAFITEDGTTVSYDGSAMDRQAAIGRSGPERERRSYEIIDGVAVIPVQGTLFAKWGLDPYSGATGYDGLTVKLREAMADDDVKAIWWDIDSPGGEVTGCFDLADEIYACNAKNGGKLMFAHANEAAYSAAYAIATSCDKLLTPRTGGVGSVGVIAMHTDITAALAEDGIKVTVIRAGTHKAEGNPYEALGDDTRAAIQAEIDDTRKLFVETVARNRGLKATDVFATEARCFGATAAKAIGFVDGIASQAQAWTELQRQISR